MGQILKFKPPDGTLKRLLQRSIEIHGGKLTGHEKRADIEPGQILPLFKARRRHRF